MDFYQRQNPKVTQNKIVGEYELEYLSNENTTLAVRIEDTSGLIYENKKVVELFGTVLNYTMNPKNGEWILNSKTSITLKRCTELSNFDKKKKLFQTNLENWYCIDFDEIEFLGGNWDGTFINYLRIDAKQCSNSSSNNNSCTSFENIQNEFITPGRQLFFSYLYQQAFAKMSNYSNPIETTLVNNYEIIDLRLTKKKIQTYKVIDLINDEGWIFNYPTESSIYSLDTEVPDFVFKDPKTEFLLYRFNVYFGKNYDSFSRNYPKIQEIFAQIGGFSNFFYLILLTIYDTSRATYKTTLITKRFSIDKPKSKIKKDNSDCNLVDNVNNQKIELSFKDESRSCNIPETSCCKKIIIPEVLIIEKEPEESFSYLTYVKSVFCPSKMKEFELEKLNDFMEERKYVENVFDVITLTKLYNEFQNLKKLILNDFQITALKLLHPKISNENEDILITKKNLIDYFSKVQMFQDLNEIDRKLLILFGVTKEKEIRRSSGEVDEISKLEEKSEIIPEKNQKSYIQSLVEEKGHHIAK